MAEIWGAAIAAAGALAGGYMASQGAKKAANQASGASDAAIAEQRREFDLVRGDTADARAIGNQAINALGRIYGYSPAPSTNALAAPASTPSLYTPSTGGISARDVLTFNPGAMVTSKLGTVGKVLDPAASLFGGSLFGNKHGDEKRNLSAFLAQNNVYDLGDGKLMLEDGTQLNKDQLQQLAGTWYGATYAPDGGQAGWQSKLSQMRTQLQDSAPTSTTSSGYRITPDGGVKPILEATRGADGSYSVPPTPAGPSTMTVSASSTPGVPDYSAFYESPDYQFRKQQGTQGIERSFAARGLGASGNALTALADYNSNLAAGEFGNYFNRQAALAGIGQTATNTATTAGMNTANNVSDALIAGGNARASGIGTSYDAWGNALGRAGNIGYNYFNQPSGYISPVQITQRRVG